MSLATRCPHCNTIFKVVQDQLKVSEGWVRCGRCSEVFNALEGLFDMERDPPPQRHSAPTTVVTTAEVSSPAVVEPPPAFTPPPPPPPRPAAPSTPVAAFPPVSPAASSLAASPPVPPVSAPSPAPAFEDIALVDPQSDTVAERPGVTHFDLDLGAPSAPRTPEPDFGGQDAAQMAARVAAALPPSMRAPAPAPMEPPVSSPAMPAVASGAPDDLPVTDEADALDSRYLLPSAGERKPAGRRRRRGPDFADAEFPDDAMVDDSDWSQSWVDTDAAGLDSALGGPTTHAPLIEPVNRPPAALPASTAATDSARPQPVAAAEPPLAAPAAVPPRPASSALDDTGPTTIPSRFGDDYQPEQALPPPSQRRGKSGTRGRAPQA